MFIKENWPTVLVALLGAIGTFRKELFSLIFIKQKRQESAVNVKGSEVNIQSTNLDNLDKTIGLYKKIIDDIIPRYEAELKEYKEELTYYRKELEKYRLSVSQRDKEIVLLHKEINDLKVDIIKLKSRK